MRIQTHHLRCVCIFLTKILTTCVIYDNISYYIIIIFAGVILTTNTAGSVVERRILLIMKDEADHRRQLTRSLW